MEAVLSSGADGLKLSRVDRVDAPWYVIFIPKVQHQVARHEQRDCSAENCRLYKYSS